MNVTEEMLSEAPSDAIVQFVTKAFETQDAFIFETIRPFCETQAHMVITKDKLIRALTLLREQGEEQKRIVSWLGKFCAHVDQHYHPLPDEQNIEFFRQKMKQQFGWEVSGWST